MIHPGFPASGGSDSHSLYTRRGFHQLLMATQDDPVGAVVVRHTPAQDTLLKTRQARVAIASLLLSRYNRPLYHPTACTTHGLEAPGPHTSSERHASGGVGASRGSGPCRGLGAHGEDERLWNRCGTLPNCSFLRGSDPMALRIDPSSGAICRGHGDTRAGRTHTPTPCAPTRRFHQQGMLGLYPAPSRWCPAAVRHTSLRWCGRSWPSSKASTRTSLPRTGPYSLRDIALPIDHKTVKQLWQQILVAPSPQLELWDYHTHPDRVQARWQAIQLYYQGWHKVSISRFLHVSAHRGSVDCPL